MREAKANLAVNNLLKDVTKKFDADKAVAQLAEIRVLAEPTNGSYTKSSSLIYAILTMMKDSSGSRHVGA